MALDSLISFLVFCQALGVTVGVICAVWAEFSFIHALRRGNHISKAEQTHLRLIAHGLRYGMTLILISSLALVIAFYYTASPVQPGLTTNYWVFSVFALLIITLTWAVSRNRISFALGSAASLTAWCFLAYFAYQSSQNLSFGNTLALYVIVAAILYAIIYYLRFIFGQPVAHA